MPRSHAARSTAQDERPFFEGFELDETGARSTGKDGISSPPKPHLPRVP